MNVLHITGWYPNVWAPNESPFVQRHIKALEPLCGNAVWHIDVRPGKKWRLSTKGPLADRTFLIGTKLQRWLILEWIATFLILWAWITRNRSRPVDLINFHIAYPNCARIRLLKALIRRPMVITEHFSAYRVGFNSVSKGIDRIRRIFHAGVPVLVVSNALRQDITRFAGPPTPHFHVVDNVVETDVFNGSGSTREEGRFFAIAGWRSPKRPDLLLDALAELRANGRPARLRLAGTGPGSEAINNAIVKLGLDEYVDVLGHLEPNAVAEEMRRAHALLHASDYETYSVVCAEALCCGTPVVASNVGGIPEFLGEGMGVLVDANTSEAWTKALELHWDSLLNVDRALISSTMSARAGAPAVGQRYFEVLRTIVASPGGQVTG